MSLHAKLAETVGVSKANSFVMEDGSILELGAQSARIAGKINADHVYVDGASVGDVGSVVLHDRRMLSRDGIAVVVIAVSKDTGLLVGRPDVVSRGFVDNQEARDMIDQSRDLLAQTLNHQKQLNDWATVSSLIRDTLDNFYYEKTHRKPIIVPVLMRV